MIANHNHSAPGGQTRWRLGAVSYLNARPLVGPLLRDPAVQLDLDVPSRLAPRLMAGEVDAALVPVIELLRPGSDLRIVSNACIAADGESLTVRVFSQVRPQEVDALWLDTDSRTSATLARLMWPDLYRREVTFHDLPADRAATDFPTVLLIGDKVVARHPRDFRYHVDLGGAWKTWTGLPFVFAVWAAPRGRDTRALAQLLNRARDRGVRQAGALAVHHGPALGWPVELAQQYLERYMRYHLTESFTEGMVRFLDLVQRRGTPLADLPALSPRSGSAP